MDERLKFELLPSQSTGYRLAITVPDQVWQRHQADDALAQNLAELTTKRNRAVAAEMGEAATQLFVNDKQIGDSVNPNRLVQSVSSLVNGVNACADQDQKDPSFVPRLSRLPINNIGRYRIHMNVRWPDLADVAVAELVTARMRETALKLRYQPSAIIPSLVYAQVNRSRGVTLETNDLGASHVGTDGSEYRASLPTFALYDQNIYSPLQQFICLVGGVALARADTLVTG